MAIDRRQETRNKSQVKLAFPHMANRIAGSLFGDLKFDVWVHLPVAYKQVGKEPFRQRYVEAEPESAEFPFGQPACQSHGIVELVDAGTAISLTKWRPASVSLTPADDARRAEPQDHLQAALSEH